MEYLYVKNWPAHQHYRKRHPPWIRLYTRLSSDRAFQDLSDTEQLHLMLLWTLAAAEDGRIPADPLKVKRLLGLRKRPRLDELVAAGFLERQPSQGLLDWWSGHEAPKSAPAKRLARATGAPDPVPHKQILDDWNTAAKAAGWRMAQVANKKRRASMRQRWSEKHWKTNYRDALEAAKGSAFLRGDNNRGWVADIDWFLRPETVAKILEGSYSGPSDHAPPKGPSKHEAQYLERLNRKLEEAKQ